MHELLNTRTGETYTFPATVDELTPEQYLFVLNIALMNMAGELKTPADIKQRLFVYFTDLRISPALAFRSSETEDAVWSQLSSFIDLLDSFFDIETTPEGTLRYTLQLRSTANLLPEWNGYKAPSDFLNEITWAQFKNCIYALRLLNESIQADNVEDTAFYGSEIVRILYGIPAGVDIPDTVQFHALTWFGYWYELITTTPININGEDIEFFTIWKTENENDDNDTDSDKSGWMGVTFSIAEKGVFGNSEQVDKQPLLHILMYIFRQKQLEKAEEKRNKNQQSE